MDKTGVQRLARVLKVLVTVTFVCNLLALVLVPGLVKLRGPERFLDGMAYFQNNREDALIILMRLAGLFVASWQEVWLFGGDYAVVLTVFLLLCGACTAVLLWQGRRVLDSILKEDTFSFANAGNMRRAAVCCFLISAAALCRMVWGLFYHGSPAPLLTYNALFIPIFLMGGLLCLVMSALFRQAAELKADHDLTI